MNIYLNYIRKIIDGNAFSEQMTDNDMKGIPFYIRYDYLFYWLTIQNKKFVFVERKEGADYTIELLRKQAEIIKELFKTQVIFGFEDVLSVNRQRMVQKNLSFIVPNKYLYLPQLFIDLRERLDKKIKISKFLQPCAQMIVLYHIQKETTSELNFKALAAKLQYSQMAITKAAEELKRYNICQIEGAKEKRIIFSKNNKELWDNALNFMTTPVAKKVYVDSIPNSITFVKSSDTALAHYTDLAEGNTDHFACSKTIFSNYIKNGQFKDANEVEGTYCIELWRYNPELLKRDNLVDPLSLFLCFRESNDERIQFALKQVLSKIQW